MWTSTSTPARVSMGVSCINIFPLQESFPKCLDATAFVPHPPFLDVCAAAALAAVVVAFVGVLEVGAVSLKCTLYRSTSTASQSWWRFVLRKIQQG